MLNFSEFTYQGAGYAVIQHIDGEGATKLHTPEICRQAGAEIAQLRKVKARLQAKVDEQHHRLKHFHRQEARNPVLEIKQARKDRGDAIRERNEARQEVTQLKARIDDLTTEVRGLICDRD